jgi:hypothetical protein
LFHIVFKVHLVVAYGWSPQDSLVSSRHLRHNPSHPPPLPGGRKTADFSNYFSNKPGMTTMLHPVEGMGRKQNGRQIPLLIIVTKVLREKEQSETPVGGSTPMRVRGLTLERALKDGLTHRESEA